MYRVSGLTDFASSSYFDVDGLIKFCVNFVASLLERRPDEIDPNETFSRIGFDSAMSVQLILALEEVLGVELNPDLIEAYPSIARLSAHLAAVSSIQPKDA